MTLIESLLPDLKIGMPLAIFSSSGAIVSCYENYVIYVCKIINIMS